MAVTLAAVINIEPCQEIGTIPAHILDSWRTSSFIRHAPLTKEQIKQLSNYFQKDIELGYAFFTTDRIYVSLRGNKKQSLCVEGDDDDTYRQ